MKPIFLNFTDENGNTTKTFSVCSLKTGLIDNVLDMAERGKKMEEGELDLKEIRAFFKDLKAIIVSVYKGQFSFDELNENVETQEMMRVLGEICANIGGAVVKN